ncbi:DNA-binding response regulator [Kitasatospora sp. NPDC057198]|uniref:helix-turn-helix transcriptional regulator n=1 Tax=Kitasatospora sp. NPDC057198 TaxID=3346046 RepID=UPI003639B304
MTTIHGKRELLLRAAPLFAGVREEFLCAAADRATWSGVADATGAPAGAAGAPAGAAGAPARAAGAAGAAAAVDRPGGLRVRKLYTPSVVADDAFAAHAFRIVAAGGLVRVSRSGLPAEMIVVDARVAVVGGTGPGGEPSYSVLRAPTVVDGLRTLFLAAWEAARDLAEHRARPAPVLDASSRAVLRTLGRGLTDESAARSLDMSLRTYRRRVAELMALLEADSRFQAGTRARELGLV